MGLFRVIMGCGIDRIGHSTIGIPVGEPIEYGVAGFEGAGHSGAGPCGVCDVYDHLYHCVVVPTRSAASHVFVLLNTREAVIAEKEVRTECSIG